MHSSRSAKDAIAQKKIADRPSIVPAGQIFGRWPPTTTDGLKPRPVMGGDGLQALPGLSKANQKCLVSNQAQNS